MGPAAMKRMMLILGVFSLLAGGWSMAAPDALGQEPLGKPAGKIILTVSGNIKNTNDAAMAHFDLEMLHALGMRTLRTSTSWTDGTQEFSGILMRDLLDAVGAQGSRVEAIALNDYSYGIDMEDFDRYPVLLATSLNGRKLRIRDKGPLWIVYPRDHHMELRTEAVDRKMVWQLRRLVVE